LLTRPTYREYIERVGRGGRVFGGLDGAGEVRKDDEVYEERDVMPEPEKEKKIIPRRRTGTLSKKTEEDESEAQQFEKQKQANAEELPRSLQRVRSRRLEEVKLQKTRSVDEEAKGKRVDRGSSSTAI
jgi:hypothetical protein